MAEMDITRIGKYEIIGLLAQGGMADIYLARQTGLKSFSRKVVLKRLLPHLAEETRFIDMFIEEAQLASQIHHHNVVRIFDVGQDGDCYFIAMEYIEGLSVGDLALRAAKNDQLVPYHVAAEIVAQACDGLHAAHELRDEEGKSLGLVHRDVSPQNLLINTEGTVKLVDFGIAKARSSNSQTRAKTIKGKLPYLSPEQCLRGPLDRRSDLFSLATVFIELLIGEKIFERKKQIYTLKALTQEPIITSPRLIRTAPGPLVEVIKKAHQRERNDRFETATEMKAAIRSALHLLGHKTSEEMLAQYLRSECTELLTANTQLIPEQSANSWAMAVTKDVEVVTSEQSTLDEDSSRATPRQQTQRVASKSEGHYHTIFLILAISVIIAITLVSVVYYW